MAAGQSPPWACERVWCAPSTTRVINSVDTQIFIGLLLFEGSGSAQHRRDRAQVPAARRLLRVLIAAAGLAARHSARSSPRFALPVSQQSWCRLEQEPCRVMRAPDTGARAIAARQFHTDPRLFDDPRRACAASRETARRSLRWS
jgi:hypothetical protein